MAVMDLIYNVGRTKFHSQYVNYRKAFLRRDWAQTAKEDTRSGAGAARLSVVRGWFNTLATQEKFFILKEAPNQSATTVKIDSL